MSYSIGQTVLQMVAQKTCPNFKFSVHVTDVCGSVLIWWQSNALCTSGFVGDEMFSHNMWCTTRLIVEGCQSAGGNAERGSTSALAAVCVASRWLTFSAASLTVHNGVWLWKRTVHCARGGSLLSSTALLMLQRLTLIPFFTALPLSVIIG